MITARMTVTMVSLAAAAGIAVLIPLLSQNTPANPTPPYDLDEAIQLVRAQSGGKVLRAEEMAPNSGVISRGVDSGGDDEDCPCRDEETDGGDDGVTTRGVTPQAQPTRYQVRILSDDGVVRTILVDEEAGIIEPAGEDD